MAPPTSRGRASVRVSRLSNEARNRQDGSPAASVQAECHHRETFHVIQIVGNYRQAITQMAWEEAPAIGWFMAGGATRAVSDPSALCAGHVQDMSQC
jgi:hypothetical protein